MTRIGLFDFLPAYSAVLRLSDLIRRRYGDAIPFDARMQMARVAVLQMGYAESDFDKVAERSLEIFQSIHPLETKLRSRSK